MNDLKSFNVRLPKDLWKFLKSESVIEEIPMVEIIVSCVEEYRKNKIKKNIDK